MGTLAMHKSRSQRNHRRSGQSFAKPAGAAALRRRVAELETLLAAAHNRAADDAHQIAELESQRVGYRELPAASPEARLNILLAISAALLVTHEIAAILRLIVHEGLKLFPGAIGTLLFLADPSAQRLVLRASSPRPPSGLTLLPGQGVAGRAFLTPRA